MSTAVWVLTNANGLGGSPVWTNTISEGAAGTPPKRAFHSAIYDVAGNRMLIFGGNNDTNVVFGDTWMLGNANGLGGTSVWAPLSTAGGPPTRSGHIVGSDPAAHTMIVFGGGEGTVLDDTWVLTNIK
jgi:drug/metabolite transporter (DMT)-like permease